MKFIFILSRGKQRKGDNSTGGEKSKMDAPMCIGINSFCEDVCQTKSIISVLIQCGCCARCVLRYIGGKDSGMYRKSVEELNKIIAKVINLPTDNAQSMLVKSDTDGEKKSESKSGANGNGEFEEKNMENISSANETVEEKKMETVISTNENEEGGKMENIQNINDNSKRSDTETISNNKSGDGKRETIHCESETETDNYKLMNNISDANKPTCMSKEMTECSIIDQLKLNKPCVVCLGILQEFSSDTFLQKVDEEVMKSDFDFSDYLCSLTIPVSILIRERTLLTYLREKFRSVYDKKNESDILSIKDVWKWRNGPELGYLLGVSFEQKSKFDIAIEFTYNKSDRECNFLVDFKPDVFKRRKQPKGRDSIFTRANVSKALSEMTDDCLKKRCKVPPSPPEYICKCNEIRCTHEAVYLAGRYNKYSRTLSQTPWVLDGKRKSESSVEEEICSLIKLKFRYKDHKFSSSGREDVDVRMLGTGRPFVIEMINPHRVKFTSEDLLQLQKDINNNSKEVKVRDLQIVSREEINNLKEGETEKTKVYSALCFCTSPLSRKDLENLSGYKDVVLQQKTPIRVLHRRPLIARERTVYTLSADYIDDHHFKLHLSTQAGTYVKEFVHGDFGRTKPNLSSITGVECDILELDVESVELDWPKKLESN